MKKCKLCQRKEGSKKVFKFDLNSGYRGKAVVRQIIWDGCPKLGVWYESIKVDKRWIFKETYAEFPVRYCPMCGREIENIWSGGEVGDDGIFRE